MILPKINTSYSNRINNFKIYFDGVRKVGNDKLFQSQGDSHHVNTKVRVI